MGLKYKVNKMIVRIRQRSEERNRKIAFEKMNVEQLKVFSLVQDLAIKNNAAIKFDNETTEILIILPKMLITLHGGSISIDNTTGFLTVNLPIEAYDLLVCIVNKEAHKERRRLKFEVKGRIHDFLNKISDND